MPESKDRFNLHFNKNEHFQYEPKILSLNFDISATVIVPSLRLLPSNFQYLFVPIKTVHCIFARLRRFSSNQWDHSRPSTTAVV